ncbi:MAG: ornithine carbamoyltransferase [Methanomassiliicoccales archaeon]|nr:ornithine carbamoyltransferase [Methanomassiliicoccales archaeon]NYT14946.1 ornithine carbamoyltransferase [Methanomassiliicoccales archaeon]
MKRDVISILDIKEELEQLVRDAIEIKKGTKGADLPLKGKTLGMIFEKSSTRTRVSFETGMFQLGGHALYLSPKDLQIGRGETIADTAKVLSRYLDAIMYRAFSNKNMKELAKNASIPVISGLDDLEHPCQIVADLQTVMEYKGKLRGLKLVYLGDGNNVCNSLMLAAAIVGMDFVACCPYGYFPDGEITRKAEALASATGCSSLIIEDPAEAVKGADILYTDVWVSMGQEGEEVEREKVFEPYQLNSQLLSKAKSDAIVLHCLPAHRGLEISAEVIDGPQSVVFDEAENRLHAQKAILLMLLG